MAAVHRLADLSSAKLEDLKHMQFVHVRAIFFSRIRVYDTTRVATQLIVCVQILKTMAQLYFSTWHVLKIDVDCVSVDLFPHPSTLEWKFNH